MPKTQLISRARRCGLLVAAAVLLVPALATALGSCSLLDGGGPSLDPEPIDGGSSAAVPPAELRELYEQELSWRECRGSMECAELEVPLDYAEPGGERLTIAVLRVPAGDPDRRIGSLVVNPGGPGASGMEYAAAADGDARRHPRPGNDDPAAHAAGHPLDNATAAGHQSASGRPARARRSEVGGQRHGDAQWHAAGGRDRHLLLDQRREGPVQHAHEC